MPHAEGGVVATRPLRLVLLPGLDATGRQHAAFSAAMRRTIACCRGAASVTCRRCCPRRPPDGWTVPI